MENIIRQMYANIDCEANGLFVFNCQVFEDALADLMLRSVFQLPRHRPDWKLLGKTPRRLFRRRNSANQNAQGAWRIAVGACAARNAAV